MKEERELKQGFISKLHFRIASEFETDDIQAIESTTILLSRAVGNTKNIVPSKSQSENVAKGKILLEKEATLVESDPIDKVRNKGAHHHVYELDLEKGKTYIIEMHAGENDKRDPKEGPFDPYLRLENPRGLQVAFDDDSGGGLDARIIYKASIDGKYKIHATTLPENQTGEYTLTVTEYDPNAANAPITPPNAPPVMKKKGPQKKF